MCGQFPPTSGSCAYKICTLDALSTDMLMFVCVGVYAYAQASQLPPAEVLRIVRLVTPMTKITATSKDREAFMSGIRGAFRKRLGGQWNHAATRGVKELGRLINPNDF